MDDFYVKATGDLAVVTSTGEKLRFMAKIALPCVLYQVVQKCQEIITLSVLGHQTHLDEAEYDSMMAGMGLGNTV